MRLPSVTEPKYFKDTTEDTPCQRSFSSCRRRHRVLANVQTSAPAPHSAASWQVQPLSRRRRPRIVSEPRETARKPATAALQPLLFSRLQLWVAAHEPVEAVAPPSILRLQLRAATLEQVAIHTHAASSSGQPRSSRSKHLLGSTPSRVQAAVIEPVTRCDSTGEKDGTSGGGHVGESIPSAAEFGHHDRRH